MNKFFGSNCSFTHLDAQLRWTEIPLETNQYNPHCRNFKNQLQNQHIRTFAVFILFANLGKSLFLIRLFYNQETFF